MVSRWVSTTWHQFEVVLRNFAGTAPNRVDDLTGEMANDQLLSPKIVTGYVMVFDTTWSGLRKEGTR